MNLTINDNEVRDRQGFREAWNPYRRSWRIDAVGMNNGALLLELLHSLRRRR